jgi:sulfate transport system ATP-binding protein
MALARALAVEPRVLLLDEPFGALDARVRAELRTWLRRLHDEVHVTTVLVTHDQEEAMEVADRIAVLDHGPVAAGRRAARALRAPANAFVMGFLGPVAQLGDRSCARTTSTSASSSAGRARGAGRARRAPRLRGARRARARRRRGGWAQVTRGEAEALELARGDIVWVRPAVTPTVTPPPRRSPPAAPTASSTRPGRRPAG